jgi:hypothetical protein
MCGTWSGELEVAVLTGAALAMRAVVGRELARSLIEGPKR